MTVARCRVQPPERGNAVTSHDSRLVSINGEGDGSDWVHVDHRDTPEGHAGGIGGQAVAPSCTESSNGSADADCVLSEEDALMMQELNRTRQEIRQHEQAIQAYKERAQEAHHSLRRHKLVHKLKTTSASSSP